MFELVDAANQAAVIKVIGVGGGGGNAVNHMMKAEVEGVDFICANTDAQALKASGARNILQLGNTITHGLGAGADPDIGRQSALEDRDRIMDVLEGADMVFITAGMGGGTGTGAAPVVAQVAKEMGILTVAVVTKPFSFEGRKRAEVANNGIRELSQHVDSLITVPNDRLVDVLGSDVSLVNAFEAADDVLLGAVQGIAQVITCQGLINVDFADVRTVMGEMGMAMMGSGKAQGEDRARVATEAAISSPLLEHIDLAGAKGILANITAGMDFGIGEFNEVGNIIKTVAAEEATVVIGTVLNQELSGEIWVTIVATGLSQPGEQLSRPQLVTTNEPGAENTDYGKLDRPTVMRKAAANDDIIPARDDPDYLEIPAFLRRQAD
ncbi:MAG: cell division protein FtsZ [Gammaproteobacteria bacterium]|nr:cell division protein FtsZ [Gammaproteobacteria bacterium]MDE0283164.1 cell division protein FtsZ [Gammaproteobacteria bacterium]MDE0510610.1 cell division protein FtsZ [Gammaproteobacteria bacterium]